jgi:hypothetical protein
MAAVVQIPDENPVLVARLFPVGPDAPVVDELLLLVDPEDRVRVPYVDDEKQPPLPLELQDFSAGDLLRAGPTLAAKKELPGFVHTEDLSPRFLSPCRRSTFCRPGRPLAEGRQERLESAGQERAVTFGEGIEKRARISTRGKAFPATIFKEVAFSLISSGKSEHSALTLSPTPITTWCSRSGSADISARIPAAFRPSR